MKLSSYERIRRFVPVFYLDVAEMDAIYRIDGEVVDEFISNVDIVKANRYINTADENEINALADFLKLEFAPESSLEERRNLLASYFTGFGKMSATKIKGIIKSLSGAESEIDFSVADTSGNNRLNINILKPVSYYSLDDIISLLSKRIAAHIWYNISVYHEKETKIVIGLALQGGNSEQMSIAGVDPDDYIWLVDENGSYLIDENGYLLFEEG